MNHTNKSVQTKAYVIAFALLYCQDKFLIAQRAATKKFAPNQWEFISGFVDSLESAAETIVREIQEELNIKGRIVNTSQPFTIIDNEGKWTVTPFLVQIEKHDIQLNPKDHSAIRWVARDELKNYPDLKPFLDNEGVQKLLSIRYEQKTLPR